MYCTHCGAEIQAEQKFCASCGKALQPGPTPTAPMRSRLQSHLQLVGVLWIAYAGLKAIAAVFILFIGSRILTHIHMPMQVQFLPGMLSALGWVFLIAAAAGIAAGWGLLEKAPWARLLAIVLAILALLNLPFGTALGIYTLWVLLPEESAREYNQVAA